MAAARLEGMRALRARVATGVAVGLLVLFVGALGWGIWSVWSHHHPTRGATPQQAVDRYVAALQHGDGDALAGVLDPGGSPAARARRVAEAEGHPVVVQSVAWRETNSAVWWTLEVSYLDGATSRQEQLLLGPAAGLTPDDALEWRLSLAPTDRAQGWLAPT